MRDKLFGAAFLLAVIGSAVYALVAVMSGLWPADWIAWREASYAFGGQYNLVEAWAVLWFHLLAAMAAPFMVVAAVATLRRRDPTPTLQAAIAERSRALSRRRLAWGLVVTALTAGFYAALVVDPQLLEPISFLARLGLVLGPFAAFVGPALILDGLLAPTAQRMVVHTLTDDASGGPTKLLDGLYRVSADEAAGLRVGSEVSLVATRIFSTVLSVTPLDPYR